VAQSGNGIDLGTIYQLLIRLSARMDAVESKLDQLVTTVNEHSRRFDQIAAVLNEHSRTLADHTRQLDDLNAGMTSLRGDVGTYHQTVVGHGIHYDELGERVTRIERHLKL
jgi:ABC-type transporter Mla subunit MlaD